MTQPPQTFQRIASPQVQMPFVDERGRLTRTAAIMLEGLLSAVQGAGGVLDILALLEPAIGSERTDVASLRDEFNRLGASITQMVLLLGDVGVFPLAVADAAPRGDLPPVARVPGSVPAISMDNGLVIQGGIGSPIGNVYGSVGDLYLRQDGGSLTTLWVKESGANSNTGWTPK